MALTSLSSLRPCSNTFPKNYVQSPENVWGHHRRHPFLAFQADCPVESIPAILESMLATTNATSVLVAPSTCLTCDKTMALRP